MSVEGQDSHFCSMHCWELTSQTMYENKSLHELAKLPVSIRSLGFSYKRPTRTKWVSAALVNLHHYGLKTQNFEQPIFMLGYFSVNDWYKNASANILFARVNSNFLTSKQSWIFIVFIKTKNIVSNFFWKWPL